MKPSNVGEIYSQLVISKDVPLATDRIKRVIVTCSCGNTKTVRYGDLRSGRTTSCGCKQLASATKHGMSNTRLYKMWDNMIRRCSIPTTKGYKHYGGKGVSVFKDWLNYEVFHQWAISNNYSEGLSIDRINSELNYEPSNCRFIAISDQQANRSSSRGTSKYIGVYLKQNQWAAQVKYKGKTNHIGYFTTELEAAQKRDKFIKLNKLPHKLNF